MTKGTEFANSILRSVFHQGGQLDIALHSEQPAGESPESNEVSYVGYRKSYMNADSLQWTVSGGKAENVVGIAFPPCMGGVTKANYISVSRGGQIKYCGKIGKPLSVEEGIAPFIKPGGLVVSEV
jgi:hypothetical protein